MTRMGRPGNIFIACTPKLGNQLEMSQAELTIFYDGGCTICSKEIALMRRLDRSERLAFRDIRSAEGAHEICGCSRGALEEQIHAIASDGTVLRGMEVFRAAYGHLGLGWLLAPTGWPGIKLFCDALYRAFARNRQRISAWLSRAR